MQKYLFPFLIFLIGFYLVGIRTVGFDFDGIPGDMGDGRLNNYFLEHGYLYLSGQINSYWDAPFFYPEKATMSMSDNLFGTLPLYALFRVFLFDRETAYQIWFLSLLALNFITCFLCFKKLKISLFASAIGAYIFTFSLPVVGGLGHIQMLPKFAFPIVIYCLIRFMQDKKSKHLFFFILFNVYQMYCGIYLGFMSILASIVVFFILIFYGNYKIQFKGLSDFFKVHWMSTILFFLLNVSLLFMLLRPYIARSGSVERDYGDIGEGLPTPISYLYPTSNSLLYDWMRPLGNYLSNSHEHTLWMGLSCLVAVLLGIYFIKTRKDIQPELPGKAIKFWLVSFLLMVLISLNFYGHISFYAMVYLIPGFEAVRAVSRIVQIELFFLGGLIAVVIDVLIKKVGSSPQRILAIAGITVFVLFDQFEWKSGLNTYSKLHSRQRLSVLANLVVNHENFKDASAFAYLTDNEFELYKYHVDAMLVAQTLNMATVNGYSAFSPEAFESFFEKPNEQNFLVTQRGNKFLNQIIIVRDQGAYLPPQ